MADQTKKTDSREKILQAAIEIFAEKSFDGARVDEIAKRAKISKALIYYNFESKQAILDELMDILSKGAADLVTAVYRTEDADPGSYKITEKGFNDGFNYLNASRDMITIIIMESIKSAGSKGLLMKLFDVTRSERAKVLKERGYTLGDGPFPVVFEFIFIVMACYVYTIFGDTLMDHHQLTREDLNQGFSRVVTSLFDTFIQPVE